MEDVVSESADSAAPVPHPLDGWSAERITSAVRQDPKSLGPMSIGRPNAGMLFNGEQAHASELYALVDPRHAFGTRETLVYLERALRKVHQAYPDSAPLVIGHISAERGGPLSPHVSHQAGRDVDISFFYREPKSWYTRATLQNLDVARTWAFVRALVTETDVEMILIDHSIQAWLKEYALGQGEDAAWVESVFRGSAPSTPPLVRHAPGHATHIHIRFYNPIAEETGRRAHAALRAAGVIPELTIYAKYRAKHGDTLKKISKRFSVSIESIQRANGLKNSRIRENREYRIPLRGRTPLAPASARRVPARRLPPSTALSQR
ncbi:MAG TPA: penicillin-insensitive murein endopeptidase [Polyangiaceae bacterium]|nr:penicillin-insensitive murein endopeptidase [Polyangiaceae bacterium]